MQRRNFIAILGGAAAAWPLAAPAQQPAMMKRVAVVNQSADVSAIDPNNKIYRPWFEELNRLGYIEGRDFVIERYSAEGRPDSYADLARKVVSTNPDVIYLASNPLALAFKANTTTIPIVAFVGDPVASGIVSSIARPNGNITGVASDAGYEISGKRLGLLLEAIPKPSNIKELASRKLWEAYGANTSQEVARRLSISVTGALLEGAIDEAEYRRVFATMERDRVDALIVSPEAANFSNGQLIVDLAAKSRIPAIYGYRDDVGRGGLMAYAFDRSDAIRHAASAVVQILKGAKPGDIPFYQVSKYELVINAKTAKALGLEIPSSLLLRADEVIE